MGSNSSKLQRPDSGDTTTAGSDEYRTSVKHKQYEFVCTTCARNYKHIEASIYCKSCRDHFCFRCLQWHSKYRSDHVDDLIGLDEMRKVGVQETPVMPTEKCLDHDDKLLNMFCQKDGIAGCQQCMEEKHRSCKSVIPRSTQHIETANRETPDDGQVDGKLKQPSLDDGQVDGRKREPHQSVKLQVDHELRQHSTDDGQVDGQKREPVHHFENVQVNVELENTRQRPYIEQVDGSESFTKQSFKTTISSTDERQVPTRHEKDGQVSGTRNQNIGLYSVESGRDVNIRLDNESDTCCICDISVLSDGRILMSDLNNDKLIKLLDSNLIIINHCVVQDYPGDICMINDNEAAMAINGRNIQFVSIEDKIELGRRFQLDHSCSGLAFSGGELYVSDAHTNIHVYTVEGKQLRTINGLGEEQLYGSERLTVSKDGSRIYMTNGRYGVLCVDRLSGEVIWKAKDTVYNDYAGVCVDMYNNLFVCRLRKGDVVQFSPSGQLTGIVISSSKGLGSPSSVGIDETRNRFIVGMNTVDVVKVFYYKQ